MEKCLACSAPLTQASSICSSCGVSQARWAEERVASLKKSNRRKRKTRIILLTSGLIAIVGLPSWVYLNTAPSTTDQPAESASSLKEIEATQGPQIILPEPANRQQIEQPSESIESMTSELDESPNPASEETTAELRAEQSFLDEYCGSILETFEGGVAELEWIGGINAKPVKRYPFDDKLTELWWKAPNSSAPDASRSLLNSAKLYYGKINTYEPEDLQNLYEVQEAFELKCQP